MFITFYSYKGGVGRTTALANIACLLAGDQEYPQKVLVWDFDLEAPGLHRVFPARERQWYGFVDLVHQYVQYGSMPGIDSFIYSSEVKGVDVLPAGMLNRAYCSKLETIDWPQFFAGDTEEAFFDQLVRSIKDLRRYDYVLIDSRTGLSDVAGICTEVLPDQLVFLFRLTAQDADGVEHLVPTVRSQLKMRRKKDVPIVPVASSVITSNSSAVQSFRTRFQELFGVPELHYIRFDMDLVGETRLFCRNDRNPDRWPSPPVLTDYANLCQVIRRRNESDVSTISSKVSSLLSTGDYASAAPLVIPVLRKQPSQAAMWRHFRKMHSIGAINNRQCDAVLSEILDRHPDNSYAHELRAIRLLEDAEEASSTEVDDAIRELDTAISLSPGRRELLRLSATVASARGDFKKALSATKIAKDGNVQASLDIAYYNIRLGGPYLAVAAEELESVVNSSSSQVPVWLSYLYAFLGREDEARKLLANRADGPKDNEPEFYLPGLAEAHVDVIAGKADQAARRAIEELSAMPRRGQPKEEAGNWIELLICAGEFDKANEFASRMKKKPLMLLSQYLGGRHGAPNEDQVLKAWAKVQEWMFVEMLMARERVAAKERKPDLARRFSIVERIIERDEFLIGIRKQAGLGSPEKA